MPGPRREGEKYDQSGVAVSRGNHRAGSRARGCLHRSICLSYSLGSLAMVALGLGPMGIAFYAWDASVKRGDPRVIAALSYLTPILSTTLLALSTAAPPTPRLGLALGLVIVGAVVSSFQKR